MSTVERGARESSLEAPGSLGDPRTVLPVRTGHQAPPEWTEDLILPEPPSDSARDAYLRGRQRRWVLWLGALAFLLIIGSLVRFALSSPALSPFLLVALFASMSLVLGIVTSSRPRRVSLDSHRRKVESWQPADVPSVDVFLPCAGEDPRVLANTYFHVSRLQWRGEIQVYVLDDSARTEVEVLALQYGFNYLSRPDRGRMKKAGNLLHGYQHSKGDVILVLDADFAPRPDILDNLMPYLDDPDVGIVQSPQFFDSDDRRMNWVQRGAGATQELFYRWVQPSRDRMGAAICVGTNAVYRRSALEAAGGFAQIGHSEDVHTGVKLRKAGFRTRYVPVNLATGLCPDTLHGFINQQYRWCAGSMSLLADRSFHASSLNLREKLAFWSGFTYYISTAIFVFLMPVPTVLMLWLFPEAVQPSNYALLLPATIWIWVVLPLFLYARWTPAVLRVQFVYAFAHAVAIWDVLRGRTADWIPTGAVATGTPVAVRVRRLMTFWTAITMGATALGILRATVDFPWVSFLPVILLTLIAAWIKIPAVLPVRSRIRHAQ